MLDAPRQDLRFAAPAVFGNYDSITDVQMIVNPFFTKNLRSYTENEFAVDNGGEYGYNNLAC